MTGLSNASVTIVADSGSTKTHWAICWENEVEFLKGMGINPMLHDLQTISDVLQNDLQEVKEKPVSRIFFYGAGCSSPERNQVVKRALQQVFPVAKIEVDHDLMAAARVLCGNQPGIACILGTGSNACRYDGREITAQHGGWGYILGDEGSGKQIGNKFLGKLLNEDLPEQVISDFKREFNLTNDDILKRVYRESHPNRFLASFMPFVARHVAEPAVSGLITDAFNEFVEVHVIKLNPQRDLPVNALGSVAFFFRELWEEALHKHGMPIGIVLREPVRKLVEYHINN